MAIGTGLLIGPALGSFLYGYLGYIYTFEAVSLIVILTIIPLLILIPSDLNKK
jgi:predicted MFS family arabinose efflux permease